MKLRLMLQNEYKQKSAIEHFKKCPACGEKNLIECNPEVICSRCDWTSCAWSVSRGAMDNLFSAALEDAKIQRKIELKRARDAEAVGASSPCPLPPQDLLGDAS
ncbi:MAG: hypothetical protein AB7O96_15810 [Pseudobdellovibrionaceae bacterium]